MSLEHARREVRWMKVHEAVAAAGLDEETVALVKRAQSVDDTFHGFAQMLIGSADVKQTKNYVKVDVVGLVAPWERLYVEVVKPGGKTSTELREMLRAKLREARHFVDGSFGRGMPSMDKFAAEIDDLLELESP